MTTINVVVSISTFDQSQTIFPTGIAGMPVAFSSHWVSFLQLFDNLSLKLGHLYANQWIYRHFHSHDQWCRFHSGTGFNEMTLICDLMNIHFSDGIFFLIWSNVDTFGDEDFRVEVRSRFWQIDIICDQINSNRIFLMALYNSIGQIEKRL